MHANKYKLAEDQIKTTREVIADKLWKYTPLAVMFVSSANKAYVNSNPIYSDYKPFYADWNLPSLIQETGKTIVKAKGEMEQIADGSMVWTPGLTWDDGFSQLCLIDPSFFDYMYDKAAGFIHMMDSPLAIAGILTSSSAMLLATLAKAKQHEDDVLPLSYYKNKSWETLNKYVSQGEEDAFRKAYDELVGGSNGLAMGSKKSRKLLQRLGGIIGKLEFDDLISFNLIAELSRSVTGKVHRREKYMRDMTKRILGTAKIDIAALYEEIKPEVFKALAIDEKDEYGRTIKKKYSMRSVIDMYIELANLEIKKNPAFNIISSYDKAYEDIIEKASLLQNQHIVFTSFSKLVAKAYEVQGAVLRGEVDESELDKYINELAYFQDISSKVKSEPGVYDALQNVAFQIRHDIASLSTDNYLELIGRSGKRHKVRAEQYSDPNFFFDNVVKGMFKDGSIDPSFKTIDYVSNAVKDYISEHMEKQYENEINRSGVVENHVDSDQVAYDKRKAKEKLIADNGVALAVSANVAVNIFQAGTTAKDADYISAPINMGSVLTEVMTFMRSPDVVMENFGKAVDAIAHSTSIAIPAIVTVGSLVLVSYSQYAAYKEDRDKYFNIEKMNSWKMVKKHLSSDDIALNNLFNHQMDTSFRRHIAKAKHSELFESIKTIDPGALAPLAIVAQLYKDTGNDKLFDRYIKNLLPPEEYKEFIVENTEALLSAYAKEVNPKKLIKEVVEAVNTINETMNEQNLVGDMDGITNDIYERAELMANLHLQTKAFSSAISKMYSERQGMTDISNVIESLEARLEKAEKEPKTLENKIIVRGLRENIQFEKTGLDLQCKKFAKVFNDVNTFAHAKKMFGDKENEYQPMQDFASVMLRCEYTRDFGELSEILGFDVTAEHMMDENLLFKEIIIPYTVKRGIPLCADATGWDYFAKAITETIDPLIPKEITQEQRLEIDRTVKSQKENSITVDKKDKLSIPEFCM